VIDASWMRRALDLAAIALGNTAPNPAVGAVLVREGGVIGEGWTQPVGQDHAEAVAVKSAQDAGFETQGSTMYVTLEPCCHQGRTPPCTDALLDAGVERVVVGTLDPFPAMRGQGLEVLRQAGVDVRLGVERQRCEKQILGFARSLGFGLPEVTSKAAISVDGHIATAAGESQWITGPLAREDGHRLRARHDAILVGIGTLLADNPRLTCRLPAVPGRPMPTDPIPVILDSSLRVPKDARLFASSQRPVIFCREDAPERELAADIVRLPAGAAGRIDIEQALRALADRGLHRVLIEGGGEVHRSAIDAGLVDSLHLYVAGTALPGGIPWIGGPDLNALADAPRMHLEDVRRVGPDVRLTYRLAHAIAPDPLVALREA